MIDHRQQNIIMYKRTNLRILYYKYTIRIYIVIISTTQQQLYFCYTASAVVIIIIDMYHIGPYCGGDKFGGFA